MYNKSGNIRAKMKEYFPMGLTAFLVLAAAILFFFLMFKVNYISEFTSKLLKTLQPIVFGLVIAYLLCPIAKQIEKLIVKLEGKLRKNKKARAGAKSYARSLSVFATIILAVAFLYILGATIIPQIIQSITKLIRDMPVYVQTVTKWSNDFLKNNDEFATIAEELILRATKYFEEFLQDSTLLKLNNMVTQFVLSITNVIGVLFNLVIGIVVSIYVMNSRENFVAQSKKLVYAIFSKRQAEIIINTTKHANYILGKFIIGKLIDSFIIGLICYIVLSILRMPYPLLISVIIGVTNIIPFFGPFIGAIPSAFLILLVSPIQCLYFIIFIIILQQIDGNIIDPKIIGESTGLSPFWIIFAILIGGGLFGFAGMLIGVPVFGVIYYIIKTLAEYSLKQKSMPENTIDFLHFDNNKQKCPPVTDKSEGDM